MILIVLVLGYEKCKKCPIGIYLEVLTLTVKINVSMVWAIHGREGLHFWDFIEYYDFPILLRY